MHLENTFTRKCILRIFYLHIKNKRICTHIVIIFLRDCTYNCKVDVNLN